MLLHLRMDEYCFRITLLDFGLERRWQDAVRDAMGSVGRATPAALNSQGQRGTITGLLGSAVSGYHVRRDKSALFQRVQVPPGDRSSRKQPEQAWR